MAAYFFKCIMQLFTILYLAHHLSAQILEYHPTAQVSTSWTNNNHSVINVTVPFDYTYSRFNYASGPFMRIILLKEIENATSNFPMAFACGFFSSTGVHDSFIFAIGIVSFRTQFIGGPQFWSDLEVVWLANRNKPISENGTLHLLPDGDLVLSDSNGDLVWSTGTSNMSVIGMKMMETGNLVLYDRNNRTVWQSFDYPADTLLPGQKLMAGQKLVARASANNWTEGNYYLSVTSQGLFAYYQFDNPQMYFQFLVRGTRESITTSYVKSINGTLALYIESAEPSEPDAVFSKPLRMRFMRFDPDGHFRVYGWGNESVDLLAEFLTTCDYPMVCGNYGLCSNGQCSCPDGFAQANDTEDNQSDSGCYEINPATCHGPHSHELLNLSDVYYFNYVDTDAADIKGTDVESCKQACLNNCSCKAALFRYFLNLSHGNCFLPSQVLSLINDGKRRNVYQSSAFIKISNHATGSSMSAKRNGIITGSSLAAFFVVVLVIGSWIVILRRKNRMEEDEDEFLDQLSGIPMRFSYKELEEATRNFQEKLGEGGFGSVFEGTLSNGEKIAVKRLDGLGQGKKEFLAEVKTMGSIHHVNLVRLIGFCAEKLHRLLVYEFMCNGSLDRWVFQRKPMQPPLDWFTRRNIILDIAKGLAYLHEECRQRVVHLDIKPQNILLDANFHAKVSDFGLSKFIDRDQSQIRTTLRGTPGYLAPEWLSSVVTEKADVYSFGIVVMEMICGRKNLDQSQPEECKHLLSLFMRKAEEDQLINLVDKNSDDMQLHRLEAVKMMRLAIWCLQSDFTRRPSMSMVVKVLEDMMDIESNLDYSSTDLTTVAETSTVLPSILSGPR